MASEWAILCKLGGYVNSNPELLSSYPDLDLSLGETSEILSKCFPIGSKPNEYIVNKYKKHIILSYVFTVKQRHERDDLFSFSILLKKKDNIELYRPILKRLIEILDANNFLSEKYLINNQKTIYEGINEEKDVFIENISIELSKMFKEIKSEIINEKPKLKGSFF